MSMDDQYREMRNFTASLMEFNEALKASVNDLTRNHEQVAPLWDDEMRRKYDATWGPFKEKMDYYVKSEAQNYVEFLHIKLHAIQRYLYGG